MKPIKILQLSFNMLVHSRLRSWLTVIGIFIGVAAVVSIISLGQGLQQSVQGQISGLGQDILTIQSGVERGFGGGRATVTDIKSLSDRDIQALKLVSGIKSIDGIVSGRTKVKFESETASLSIQGHDQSVISDFVTAEVTSGRFISQGESRSAVIGSGVATNVFSKQLSVGYLLMINGKPFRVVGILASTSGLGGGGSDNTIYMSSKDARDVLNTSDLNSNEYSSISVKVFNADFINDTTNKITTSLLNSHHVLESKKDFTVSSPLALQERFSSITSGITLFLAIIAGVSLFVGSIGVANTMFTSVLEKTKDIGVMKAIGAKNRDILMIFLFNSGMLGLAGGLLGVMAGSALAMSLPSLGLGIPLPIGRGGLGAMVISLNWSLISLSLIFSMIIGMVSGAIPAYNASRLKPIEALRYE